MNPPRTIKAVLPILLLATGALSDEPKPSELEHRGIVAMHASEYQQAEEIFAELIELRPDSFVGHYNKAAAHSMQGEIEPAIESISRAIGLGFTDRLQLQRDPDLGALRKTAFFDELMGQWDALIESRRQSDLQTLKGLVRRNLQARTDEDHRLELLSAHDETATDQAHEELRLIAQWAQDELFTGLDSFILDDSPWIIVVLPDRPGFARWAIDTFGPGVRGSLSSVGGAYEHQQRRLVAQDLGATLRHEFIHVLHWRDMNRLGQTHAPWIQEGLASLIDAFTAKRPLAQYAQARALMLWLYQTDRLHAFYTNYTEHISDDPTGYKALLVATDTEPEELETKYRDWVRALPAVPETGSDLDATLGIEIENADGDGVVVRALPGNARSRTGLRLGSVITHINGRPTRDLFELIRVLGDYRPGQSVTLHHRRGRIHSTSDVTLQAR